MAMFPKKPSTKAFFTGSLGHIPSPVCLSARPLPLGCPLKRGQEQRHASMGIPGQGPYLFTPKRKREFYPVLTPSSGPAPRDHLSKSFRHLQYLETVDGGAHPALPAATGLPRLEGPGSGKRPGRSRLHLWNIV